MHGTVRALLVKSGKGVKSTLRDSVKVTASGLDGDHHTGVSRRRQILLMSGSVLDQFDLEPGDIHENIVIDGFDVMSLQEGHQLRLGGALVSVTVPCEPCLQMDRVRPGLKEALKDCRGMFVMVLEPGVVRVGDPVWKTSAVENSQK